MVFNWLLTPQIHKYTSGYYLNHDNLIIGIYIICILLYSKQGRPLETHFLLHSISDSREVGSRWSSSLQCWEVHFFLYIDSLSLSRYIDVEIRAFSMAALAGIYTFTKLGSMSFISSKIFRRPLLNASLYATAGSIKYIYNQPSWASASPIT